MNSNLYLNLIEGDTIAARTETTTRFDLLRRQVINSRNSAATATPSKFTLAGTELDAVLGRIVTIKVSPR